MGHETIAINDDDKWSCCCLFVVLHDSKADVGGGKAHVGGGKADVRGRKAHVGGGKNLFGG